MYFMAECLNNKSTLQNGMVAFYDAIPIVRSPLLTIFLGEITSLPLPELHLKDWPFPFETRYFSFQQLSTLYNNTRVKPTPGTVLLLHSVGIISLVMSVRGMSSAPLCKFCDIIIIQHVTFYNHI